MRATFTILFLLFFIYFNLLFIVYVFARRKVLMHMLNYGAHLLLYTLHSTFTYFFYSFPSSAHDSCRQKR